MQQVPSQMDNFKSSDYLKYDTSWERKTRYWANWGPLIVISTTVAILACCIIILKLCNRYGRTDMYDINPLPIVVNTGKSKTYGTNSSNTKTMRQKDAISGE